MDGLDSDAVAASQFVVFDSLIASPLHHHHSTNRHYTYSHYYLYGNHYRSPLLDESLIAGRRLQACEAVGLVPDRKVGVNLNRHQSMSE